MRLDALAPQARAKAEAKIAQSDRSVGLDLRLVCACIAWPLTEERLEVIRSLAATPEIKWAIVEKLTLRHRILGLVGYALSKAGISVPEPQLTLFQQGVLEVAFRELRTVYETKRIMSALEREGLAPILLKGIAVSARAFGRLGLRQNRDIDILVEPPSIERAERCLEKLGCIRSEPKLGLSRSEFATWLSRHKDAVYQNERRGLIVELHWRLFDNRYLLSVPEKGFRWIEVAPGQVFKVLPSLFEVIYLCVHGAQHAWSRLKWLADVSAIITRMTFDELAELMVESRRLKVEAAVYQALLLCNRLFDVQLEENFRQRLLRSRRLRRLYRISLICIAAGDGLELEDQRFGSTRKNISHYLLKPDFRYWLSEVQFDLTESSAHNVPAGIKFLAPFYRIITWGWKRLSWHRSPYRREMK